MKIKYRGNWFGINATPNSLSIVCDKCDLEATRVKFQGREYELSPGETLNFDISND